MKRRTTSSQPRRSFLSVGARQNWIETALNSAASSLHSENFQTFGQIPVADTAPSRDDQSLALHGRASMSTLTHGRLRLTRARGESILIGPDLELHVTRVAHSRVLLALYMNSAPRNNGIHLSDLFHCTKGDRVSLAPGVICEIERVGGTHVQLVIEAPRLLHIRRAELAPQDQLIA